MQALIHHSPASRFFVQTIIKDHPRYLARCKNLKRNDITACKNKHWQELNSTANSMTPCHCISSVVVRPESTLRQLVCIDESTKSFSFHPFTTKGLITAPRMSVREPGGVCSWPLRGSGSGFILCHCMSSDVVHPEAALPTDLHRRWRHKLLFHPLLFARNQLCANCVASTGATQAPHSSLNYKKNHYCARPCVRPPTEASFLCIRLQGVVLTTTPLKSLAYSKNTHRIIVDNTEDYRRQYQGLSSTKPRIIVVLMQPT